MCDCMDVYVRTYVLCISCILSAVSMQMLYCSVGIWNGLSFNKVGEGLCPRGGVTSASMIIQTAAIGSAGDLFVGGE